VLTGSKCVTSYDPDTGKQLWIIDGPTEQFVSSVVLHNGVILLTAGFPVYWVMAIDPSGTGNVTKTHVLWSKKNEGTYVPSPVAYQGKLFLVDDTKYKASCWDVKTGKDYWQEQLSRSKHHASAVVADGRIYFTSDEGITFVRQAADFNGLLFQKARKPRILLTDLLCLGAARAEFTTQLRNRQFLRRHGYRKCFAGFVESRPHNIQLSKQAIVFIRGGDCGQNLIGLADQRRNIRMIMHIFERGPFMIKVCRQKLLDLDVRLVGLSRPDDTCFFSCAVNMLSPVDQEPFI